MCSTSISTESPEGNSSGIPDCVPSDPISQQAYALAHKHLPLAILNHSLRVWIYAQMLSELSDTKKIPLSRIPLLFTACLLHDIGATPAFANLDSNELQRFEIEGADAAAALLEASSSTGPDEIEEVWRAIALHSTPQIPERMAGMVRIVRIAVLTDFGGASLPEEVKKDVEGRFPRLGIEKVLGNAVVAQALNSRLPERKAPTGSWPHDLLRAHREVPEWEGVNKGF